METKLITQNSGEIRDGTGAKGEFPFKKNADKPVNFLSDGCIH